MDNVSMLIFAIVLSLLVVWGIEASRLYKSYKGELYGTLFGGFLPYFFRYAVRKDCSESGFLKTRIGTHRMIFSAMKENGQTAARFCTILYNRGIMVYCYQKIEGELLGKPKDKDWIVRRTDSEGSAHSFRHPNPTVSFEAYLRRIASACPEVHLEARIAVDDLTVYDHLKSDIKLVHYKDIVDELIQVQSGILSDEQILKVYEELTGQKD